MENHKLIEFYRRKLWKTVYFEDDFFFFFEDSFNWRIFLIEDSSFLKFFFEVKELVMKNIKFEKKKNIFQAIALGTYFMCSRDNYSVRTDLEDI